MSYLVLFQIPLEGYSFKEFQSLEEAQAFVKFEDPKYDSYLQIYEIKRQLSPLQLLELESSYPPPSRL